MKTANHPDTVLIVDFGSQFTQLIARRIREAGVFSEIVPFQSAEAAFKRINPKAVILSGGPASTSDIGSPRAPQIVFDAGVPVLGICYGQMAMCVQMGGVAERDVYKRQGSASDFLVDKLSKDCTDKGQAAIQKSVFNSSTDIVQGVLSDRLDARMDDATASSYFEVTSKGQLVVLPTLYEVAPLGLAIAKDDLSLIHI